jgi:hypothetical protein
MAEIEWKPLPTPMWPEGSVMADWSGLLLEASFEQAPLDGYLSGQNAWLVNYADRHCAGLRVGTAITAGTANFLVLGWMNKSQQMRWSRRGADLPRYASIRDVPWNNSRSNPLSVPMTLSACFDRNCSTALPPPVGYCSHQPVYPL